MNIPFSKYHGTGNDFIFVDDFSGSFPSDDKQLIAKMCHRRFGIGADGLVLLRKHPEANFEMLYYNADGGLGSFCGNASRCAVHFARSLGYADDQINFVAYDGPHKAHVEDDEICILMSDVNQLKQLPQGWLLDTGSPHVVVAVDDAEELRCR